MTANEAVEMQRRLPSISIDWGQLGSFTQIHAACGHQQRRYRPFVFFYIFSLRWLTTATWNSMLTHLQSFTKGKKIQLNWIESQENRKWREIRSLQLDLNPFYSPSSPTGHHFISNLYINFIRIISTICGNWVRQPEITRLPNPFFFLFFFRFRLDFPFDSRRNRMKLNQPIRFVALQWEKSRF